MHIVKQRPGETSEAAQARAYGVVEEIESLLSPLEKAHDVILEDVHEELATNHSLDAASLGEFVARRRQRYRDALREAQREENPSSPELAASFGRSARKMQESVQRREQQQATGE